MKSFLKNPKTYILLIIVAPMIALGVFSFNYYQIYKNSVGSLTDNSNSSNANIIVKNPFETIDIIEDDNEEVLPTIKGQKIEDIELIENAEEVENKKELTTNETIVESNTTDSKTQESNISEKTIGNTEIASSNKTQNTSYNYIVGTYKNKFEKLQKKQESNLYSLMEQGKAEYLESSEKNISVISLANKYLSLVNNMEKQSDKEFNALINNLKAELTSNSYKTDIVKEISDYYSYYKKSLRAQLFKKAADNM